MGQQQQNNNNSNGGDDANPQQQQQSAMATRQTNAAAAVVGRQAALPSQQQQQQIGTPKIVRRHQNNNNFSSAQQQPAATAAAQSSASPSSQQLQQHRQKAAAPNAAMTGASKAAPIQFTGSSQFDTQSFQARRSRSFAAQNPKFSPTNGTMSTTDAAAYYTHQQSMAPFPPMAPRRYGGSCSNLSVCGGAAAAADEHGQLVVYDAGSALQQQQRHSMLLDAAQMASQQYWYQPMMPPMPAPPPFYYTAATLPHPGPAPATPFTPMNLVAFKRAMKESKRMEKKQRKMLLAEMGEQTFGSACCEFCCGGSALILWLVITLIALGFLGFLLLAIYFV